MPPPPRRTHRPRTIAPAPALDFERWIVWQDEWLMAVDKPAGVLSQGGEGGAGHNLVDLARAHLGRATGIGVLHRIDRNVSGLVLLAKHPRAARGLSMAIERGELERVYRAVVLGVAPAASWTMDQWLAKDERRNEVTALGAERVARLPELDRRAYRAAVTRARVLDTFRTPAGPCAVLEVRPITGRSHQIRVHLRAAGLPLAGDPKYGVEIRGLNRPLLHATALAFEHPITRARIALEAPPPWSAQLLRTLALR